MKELKNKLNKAKRMKFLRNIFIGIITLIIAMIIVNVAPGYRRDKYKDVINLVLNNENVTEHLKNDIYINDKNTIYISEDDIRDLFDATIYFDEEYSQIITTSRTKVANIVIDEKKMIVNGVEQQMIDSVIRINNKIYLPISDMTKVYNIDVQYIPSTKIVVIDNLDKGIIRAIVSEETEIKYKPRRFSKNIGILKQGETVYAFYTTSKGWRQIRTQTGVIRIYKSK